MARQGTANIDGVGRAGQPDVRSAPACRNLIRREFHPFFDTMSIFTRDQSILGTFGMLMFYECVEINKEVIEIVTYWAKGTIGIPT